MSPDRLGRYELIERLGVGAFATVYRALDPRLDSHVAVKVLADNWSADPEIRRRFQTEAVLLRRLHSERPIAGLVDVYDIDETESGQPFFVMRWADRGTLRDRMVPGVGAEPSQVAQVVDFIGATLEALHGSGVVHRDIKPSNILISSNLTASPKPAPAGPATALSPDPPTGAAPLDGAATALVGGDERLLLGDLGLAKDLASENTALSVAGGTAAFMAPEQAQLDQEVDHRADIYAASAVILEMLTGTAPLQFIGESNPALDRLAPPVAEVLKRGMAVDPDERTPEISRWRADLVAALVRPLDTTEAPVIPPPPPAPSAGGPSTPAPTVAPPVPIVADGEVPAPPGPGGSGGTDVGVHEGGRRRIVVGAVVGLLAVALGFIAFSFMRGGNSGPEIVGPDEIEVGLPVDYQAAVDGSESFFWTDWNGEEYSGGDFRVLAKLPGELTFSLTTVSSSGSRSTSSKTIQVTASPLGPVIEGPSEIEVGDVITYQANTGGATSHLWRKNGVRDEDADNQNLEVEPIGDGLLTLTLLATYADGVERGVRMIVTVKP